MNSIKRTELARLNKQHDEVYEALHAAQEKLAEAKGLQLGDDVVARHLETINTLKGKLVAIEAEREPLAREEERTTTRFRATVGYYCGFVTLVGVMIAISKGIIDLLNLFSP